MSATGGAAPSAPPVGTLRRVPTPSGPGVAPFVLPRPADWRHGRPAPWRAHDGWRPPTAVPLDLVAAALAAAGHGEGDPAAPPIAEWPGVEAALRPEDAGVLLALFEEDGDARLVLERRSEGLRRHRGEVGFPGGRVEPGESPRDAALREAHEEVGLEPSAVALLGWLTPLRTYSGLAVIHPYVGALGARPVLAVAPSEVAFAFDVPLSALLADEAFREELWRRPTPDGAQDYVAIYVFEAGGEVIWGATARILAELCTIVARAAVGGTPPG